jgi:hypothetical protein
MKTTLAFDKEERLHHLKLSRYLPILRTVDALRILALLILVSGPVILSWQGWRQQERVPASGADLVTSAQAAWDLLHHGTIPSIGAVSSTLGRIPPGSAWLLLPGVALSNDRRLYELPSTALLHLLTVTGIIVLGKLLISEACGWLAASLYAYSWTAMFFSALLWPRGHPAFVVWVVICCVVALRKSQPSALALAAVIYAAGMYVAPEILPLGIALPLTVAWNRRTFSWRWAVPAVASCLMIWAPYLHTQIREHFVDVRYLAGAPPVTTQQASPAWCESPQVVYDIVGRPIDIAPADLHYPPRPHFTSIWQKVGYSVEMFLQSWKSNMAAHADERIAARCFNVALFGLLILGCFRMRRDDAGLLVLTVFLAGQIMWGLLGGGEDRRFYWLWPMQCIIIASAVLWLCTKVQIPWPPVAVLLLILSAWDGGTALAHIRAWRLDSWSGHDDQITEQIDRIARNLPPGTHQTSISYDAHMMPYFFWFNPVDPRYTVSMVYDQYLLHRYGVRNAVFCVDSYKSDADYVVRESATVGCCYIRRVR